MVASYLLDAGERNHNLDELAAALPATTTTIKISELIGTGKNQKRMDEVPVAQITPLRGRRRRRAAAAAADPGRAAGASRSSTSCSTDVEMPLVEVLVELEFNGISVDAERLAELSEQVRRAARQAGAGDLRAGRARVQHRLAQATAAGPVRRAEAAGAQEDQDRRQHRRRRARRAGPAHPLPAKIIEYRQYAKLKSTYVDALPQMVHPQTGRVHASFNQVVAATGRLSSQRSRTCRTFRSAPRAGREIRSAFLPGHDGLEAAGGRLLADRAARAGPLLAAMRRCARPSPATRTFTPAWPARCTACRWTTVTSEMRRQAKAVNFGVIYGQSPFGLAKQLDIEQDEAAQFIDAYFERYPGVEEFLDADTGRMPARTAMLVPSSAGGGRFAAFDAAPARQRNLPERTAINTVIQGSAADLIKLAMIDVHRRLRANSLPARMLLQIHDELVFEVPPDELNDLAQLCRDEMSGVHAI